MINLNKYKFKHVKIIDTDGDIFFGFVDVYMSALNDPDGIENIAIIPYNLPNWDSNNFLGLKSHEISQIETIEPIEIIIYPKTYQPQAVAV
ncbi:MAG: hypothetical protein FWG68_12640 [Defluviitaleaceae bacterium]|nr:hypothetical protein [Defluviitaleaceae bacterium]